MEKLMAISIKEQVLVAAQINNKIILPLEYSGTMDSTLFEYWFKNILLHELPTGSVIVMDNASFHRKKQLLSIAEEMAYRLIFLPPYSPELNPIEKFWSCLKRRLQKIFPFFDSFDDALYECFQVA